MNNLWISRLKSEFEKSPLASNVAFGFILVILEKLLEIEFVCPCDPSRNLRFVVIFFLAPAFLAFVLMMKFQGCETKKSQKEWAKVAASSVVPSIVWIILLFFDGQYFVCAKSSQSGNFEEFDSTTHRKLCTAASNITSELTNNQKWYSVSQEIGMWLIFVLGVIVILHIYCAKEEQVPRGNGSLTQVSGHQDPEASVPTHKQRSRSRLGEASDRGAIEMS